MARRGYRLAGFAWPGWGPLAERNFRLLFLARSISALGDRIALVALAFAVLEFGGATELGLVILAREGSTAALVLFGGVWADRVSRYRLLLGADLLRFGSQALTAWLVLAGEASVWNLTVLQLAYGAGTAFFLPTSTSLVPQIVPPERLQPANALLALSFNGFGIVGPAVGAALVVVASPGWGLVADAVSFLLAAVFLVQLRVPETDREPRRRVFAELAEGWREFSSRTWVWVMVASFGVFQLAVFPPLFVLGPVIAKNELGGAGAWGTILAVGSIGALLGSVLALRVRAKRPLVATQLLSIPLAIYFALLAGIEIVWLISLAALAGWLFVHLADTIWHTTLQQQVPEKALGRISSYDWFGSIALNPVGYAIVGPLAAATGERTVLLGAAALQVITVLSVLLVPSVRGVRTRASEPTR